jgi:hypothetical protein
MFLAVPKKGKNCNRLTYFSLAVFSLIFFLFYGMYLFYLHVPGFSNDAIEYFYAAFRIVEGDLPIINMTVDIPMGYPLFMSGFIYLGLDIFYIILLQIACQFFASLFLIYQVGKIHPFAGFMFSFMMGFWIIDPHVMNHNTYFYPDSLFATSLILIAAGMILYFRSDCLVNLIFLLCAVFLSVLIRSNGLFAIFIPAILIIKYLLERNIQKMKQIVVIGSIGLLLISFFNLKLKAYFFPGDYVRIQSVTHRLFSDNSSVEKKVNRFALFSGYVFHSKEMRPSFYYTR